MYIQVNPNSRPTVQIPAAQLAALKLESTPPERRPTVRELKVVRRV
jgi:hypothetical protein